MVKFQFLMIKSPADVTSHARPTRPVSASVERCEESPQEQNMEH